MVYEPREDSYFLAGYVKEHARGNVLDMCTGSGVQAKAALHNEMVDGVLAVDVDEQSVELVREELQIYDTVRVLQSDLFHEISKEEFDTIICNPPYLPDELGHNDSEIYGGRNGWEFIERFLRDAKGYLAQDGQILMLFSSLTNKDCVEKTMKDLDYRFQQLGEMAMFFERLYVYRVIHG